jgi:septum formation protein
MKIILASKSPRRREILENLGIKFTIITEETDESSNVTEPSELVRELAERKGAAVVDKIINMIKTEGAFDGEETLVLSSDTVVASDGAILGKPRDLDDARDMLHRIEGRGHSVFSGIAASLISGGEVVKKASAVEETVVRFSPMTEADIDFYVNNENVLDKAGAYAIQGIASAWIDGIDGDYFNVVGLPVRRLMTMLGEEFGLTLSALRE